MNERNLPRTLSTSVVDALKAQGHILVVKGGATALARELSDLMAPRLAQITPRIDPYPVVGGEVTSTFGHESIDDAVEEMVAALTRSLMDSEHVEDVFAEDNVIRRDIFRTLRDGLLTPAAREAAVDDDPTVPIVLDTLGYVAATVSKRAEAQSLREALSRAADIAAAQFTAYDPETRTATFVLEDDEADARLELEEAIADELTDLVDDGSVELPTIERRIDLGRTLTALEQRSFMGRVDAAGKQTLLRAGCHATWEFETGRTLRVTFTPFSDQDARDVDVHIAVFARELAAALHAALAAQTAAPLMTGSPGGAPAGPPVGQPPRRAADDHDLDRDRDEDLDQEEEEEPHAGAKAATPKRAVKAAPKRAVKAAASSSPRKSAATAKSPATAKRAATAKAKVKVKKAPAKKR